MKNGKVTVIIPNLNGQEYIRDCLDSLKNQTAAPESVIVVDNGSEDESVAILRREYPWVQLIALPENLGFCGGVNYGIRKADTEYVILLNNDTRVEPQFVEELLAGIQKSGQIFSCQAKMVQMAHPDLVDDAGDFYCALGWAIARGKGKPVQKFDEPVKIFASCAGAAIYRKKLIEKLGYFDEAHFAYLEDIDLGYRARIAGYENWFAPKAVVYHIGSAASGSRYNKFKVSHAARNNIYLIYKNMARWQILMNLPFLAAGHLVKLLFFLCRGFGGTYLSGMWQGVLLARKGEKVPFLPENFDNCWKIQMELWKNIGRIFQKFL